MIIKCLHNTGHALRQYEYKPLENEILGRFGSTAYSQYNELSIGQEYLVMGLIIFETYQAYLIDDNGFISVFPCQLFEVIDSKMTPNWHFRLIEKNEDLYPFIQAIFGYYELCFDKKAYESLIIERSKESQQIYFK